MLLKLIWDSRSIFSATSSPPDLHEIHKGPVEPVQVHETHHQDQDHENHAGNDQGKGAQEDLAG